MQKRGADGLHVILLDLQRNPSGPFRLGTAQQPRLAIPVGESRETAFVAVGAARGTFVGGRGICRAGPLTS